MTPSAHLTQQAEAVLRAAMARDLTIATAESCTGGLLAALMTDVEGCSSVVECGLATYSEQSKVDILGVTPSLLERYGAVSEPVAREMAIGALRISQADIAVAITGFAGPGGPDDEEGLVHFAVAGGDGLRHACEHYGKLGREEVRAKACARALTLLGEAIEDVAISVKPNGHALPHPKR